MGHGPRGFRRAPRSGAPRACDDQLDALRGFYLESKARARVVLLSGTKKGARESRFPVTILTGARRTELSSNYESFRGARSQSGSLLGLGFREGTRPRHSAPSNVQTEPPREPDGEARPQRCARRLGNLTPRPAARRARSRERNPIQPARFTHPDAARRSHHRRPVDPLVVRCPSPLASRDGLSELVEHLIEEHEAVDDRFALGGSAGEAAVGAELVGRLLG
jgi:hypothetical protein